MIVGGRIGGGRVQLTRRVLAVILLGVVILSAAAGWLARTFVRSPADVAARTAPPVASPILVPVERQVLSSNVVTRGTGRFGSPQLLAVAPTALNPAPLVVAQAPAVGAELNEGDVLLTASARPVFLLAGIQPTFRDLGPGMEGQDIRQLEEALVRLGFDPGDVDGVFDDDTESAVTAWYHAEGYEPARATSEQLAGIRALEAELAQSRLDFLAARDAVSAADAGAVAAQAAYERAKAAALRGPAVLSMAAQLASAANQAAEAEVASRTAIVLALTAPPRTTPATPAEIAAAEADLNIAIANQQVILLNGQQAVAAAIAGGDPDAIAAAQALATAANAAAAAEVAAKQETLDAVKGGTPGVPPTAAEIATAQADLAAAQSNRATTRLAGEQAIIEAQGAADAARAEASAAGANLAAARDALGNAKSALSERYAPLDNITLELGLQRRRAGVQVPASEVVFVPNAPVRVATVNVRRGEEVTGPVMTVTDAVVAIDGGLPLEAAGFVQTGMPVQIDEPDLGIAATGVISRIADTPGTNGTDGFHIYFEVLVDGSPERLVGTSLRLTIPVESTGGEALIVPVSALSLAPDGSSRVQRQRDGASDFVAVTPGLSANGLVAVTPVDGDLQAGDLIVVGFDETGRESSTPVGTGASTEAATATPASP